MLRRCAPTRREPLAKLEAFLKTNSRRYTTKGGLQSKLSPTRFHYLSRTAQVTAIAAAATLLLQTYSPWRREPLLADSQGQGDRSERFYRWGAQAPIVEGEVKKRRKSSGEGTSQQYTGAKDATSNEGLPDPEPPDQRSSEAEARGLKWPGFSQIGDKITDLLVPDWVKLLPAFISKLQKEMSLAPGTLAEQIWWEAHDPECNPEITWDANVRVSGDLCEQEKAYLETRRKFTRNALARYLDLDEKEVHPDDVPTIAMCGSGGGLRALVAGTSSYLSAQEAGLFDCVTYTAGNHENLIRHLKHRLGVHIAFPPAALSLLNSAPTNKFLLNGIVEKLKGTPDADFGLVDIYGLLLAARLLVPKGELAVNDLDLKVSNQKQYVDTGRYPLPIYTTVRHEIPFEEQNEPSAAAARARAKKEAWFQWFEITPYEFFCEELEAGIPTWAMGRDFQAGKTVWRDNGLALPEIRVPLMMGIWGSAFCATLSHYYKEIRPLMRSLAGFGGIDSLIAERDSDLVKIHPIDPATIPNFALGLENELPTSVPASIFKDKYLQLMDAGMSNNLPIYPLLRPGRDVDIVIAFDASADVKKDNWLKEVDGYARQRNIKGWPMGTGWPPSDETQEQVNRELKKAQSEKTNDPADSGSVKKPEREDETTKLDEQNVNKADSSTHPTTDLSFCNIWVGSTADTSSADTSSADTSTAETSSAETSSAETSSSPSTISQLITHSPDLSTHHPSITSPSAGITVIYFPFLPNPSLPSTTDVNPQTSDFMSTWNFIYTPEQIEDVVSLARANFKEGEEQTKRTVRAVYERKKTLRREKERVEMEGRRRWMGSVEVGDHFS